MRALQTNPVWREALKKRWRQKFFGALACVFLTCALIALLDGLIAQVRAGNDAVSLLAGQSLAISGLAPIKNPLASDLKARFDTPNCPLLFEFEGFFAGHWFGNGMWRGKILAPVGARSGQYALRVSFVGASAATAQNYVVNLYANAEAERAASLSAMRAFFGFNPFIVAALCGAVGVVGGCVTYFFGRQYARLLESLGITQIYRYNEKDGLIRCFAPAKLAPPPGACRAILDENGAQSGEARALSWRDGKLELQILDSPRATGLALICLHPVRSPKSERRSAAKEKIK